MQRNTRRQAAIEGNVRRNRDRARAAAQAQGLSGRTVRRRVAAEERRTRDISEGD